VSAVRRPGAPAALHAFAIAVLNLSAPKPWKTGRSGTRSSRGTSAMTASNSTGGTSTQRAVRVLLALTATRQRPRGSSTSPQLKVLDLADPHSGCVQDERRKPVARRQQPHHGLDMHRGRRLHVPLLGAVVVRGSRPRVARGGSSYTRAARPPARRQVKPGDEHEWRRRVGSALDDAPEGSALPLKCGQDAADDSALMAADKTVWTSGAPVNERRRFSGLNVFFGVAAFFCLVLTVALYLQAINCGQTAAYAFGRALGPLFVASVIRAVYVAIQARGGSHRPFISGWLFVLAAISALMVLHSPPNSRSSGGGYSAEVINAFTRSCQTGAEQAMDEARAGELDTARAGDYCSCLIQRFEETMPFEDFVALNDRVSAGDQTAFSDPRTKAAIAQCAPRA
jgi:hypothetical protein